MANIIPLPQSTFNPMGTGQLSNPLAGSIDALFNAYKAAQATKLQNAQIPGIQAQTAGQLLQNQGTQQALDQGQANFRLQNQGLTPQDVNQNIGAAMQPAPSLYGPGISPQQGAGAIPGAPMQPGQQMQLGPQAGQQVPSGEDPKIATLRGILQMHLAGQQLGARQQGAALQNVQSEAYQHTAEGNFQQAQADLLSGQGGGGIGALVDAVKNKTMTPEQAFGSVSTRNGGALALAGAFAKAGIDVNALNSEAEAGKSGAKAAADLTQGGSSQEMARSANSAYKQFDLLQKASDSFARTNNQLLNTPLLKIDATKYPQAQVFKTALSTARIEYARAASGSKSPSDTFMQEARAALPDGITAAQIGPTLDQLRNSLSEQTRGQLSQATIGNAPPLIDSGPKAPAPGASLKTAIDPKAESIIKTGLSAGHSREQIKASLRAGGF